MLSNFGYFNDYMILNLLQKKVMQEPNKAIVLH